MRIKNYENWKLSSLYSTNTQQKNPYQTQTFLISRLLEIPSSRRQHDYNPNNPNIINNLANLNLTNNLANLNHRVLNKKDIQLSDNLVKLQQRTEREENIKSKIKSRIKKEQFINDSFIVEMDKTVYRNGSSRKQARLTSSFDGRNHQPKQASVYVKGSSLPFDTFCQKKRSKSTVFRTQLKSSPQSSKLYNIKRPKLYQKEPSQNQRFHSVQMKRQNSLTLADRKKIFTQDRKNLYIKDIDPWQFDDGPQMFEI